MTPDVMFHAAAGGIGLVSGAAALVARKGSGPHRAAGNIFVAAMILTGVTAIYLGLTRNQSGNAVGGILVVYMLATAWVAAKRRDNESGLFEVGAFAASATGAAGAFYFTLLAVTNGTALLGGIPGFIMSAVATLTAGLDFSVIVRRGIAGRQRIARHLWRMHLGFFAAVGSFFPGQLQFFPDFIQQVKPVILLFLPAFTILVVMAYWLIRVLFTRWHDGDRPLPAAEASREGERVAS
jgi:uncharacterized membrane protein